MTLELRRLHADLIMCYKNVFIIVPLLDFSDFFSFLLLLPLAVILTKCIRESCQCRR